MTKRIAWPQYYERALPYRTYAYDECEGQLITEHGELLPYDNWNDITRLMHDKNLIIVSEDLTSYIDMGCVEDPKTKVMASAYGKILSISNRGFHNTIRHIVHEQSWNGTNQIGNYLIVDIRKVMDHCKVGDRQTPSVLGRAIARKVWQENFLQWHYPVARDIQRALRDFSSTPRTDCPGMGYKGEEAWEYDLNSGYPNHFRSNPTGKSVRILQGDSDDYKEYATWFRKCTIQYPEGIRFSPIYLPKGVNTTAPGHKIDAWIWKEEYEELQRIGAIVQLEEGIAWTKLTDNNSFVMDTMLELKGTCNGDVLAYMKRIILAYIGRFAMQADIFEVVDYCKPLSEIIGVDLSLPRPRDTHRPLLNMSHRPKPYYFKLKSLDKGGMIHWQRYTIMKTNMTLYKVGIVHSKELLMMNFDSILLRSPIKTPRGWKEEHLTNVEIPYARALISDQKTRLPGGRLPEKLR